MVLLLGYTLTKEKSSDENSQNYSLVLYTLEKTFSIDFLSILKAIETIRSISSAVDDSIERPFEDIAQELRACRVLAISIFAQGAGLILGIWATSAIFKGNVRFTLVDWDFTRNESTRTDVTNFLRFYQLLMLNLSVMTFIAAVSNWWTTKQRVERYFNRIGSTQEPLSTFMDEGNFYQDYLKTRRGSTYRITR